MTFADPALATGEATLDRRLEAFGAVVAEEIEPAVAELEACRDLPATDGERGRIPACLRAGRAGGLGLGNRQGSRLRAGGAALPARARGRRRSRLPGRLHRGPRPGARARGLTRARIRKLKDKLGTRALATGEIDFDRALGYAIGAPEDGFRIAAGVVLNTSRWLNALGTTGLMRRAYLVASAFAHERTAFGRPIVEFPLVRENLAVMKAETQAAFASTLELTRLVERIDAGTATEDDVTWHRILVNANKFVTSLAATRVMRRAIETLGGNGTIEDFSPLPRLYRDAIVFESWEGTHNVLCLQVLRGIPRRTRSTPT